MSSHTALRPLTRGSHSFAKFRLRMTRTAREQWRISSAQLRATPSFVIIGAQRGGTTLGLQLAHLASGCPARIPEGASFLRRQELPPGMRWYRSRFPIAPPGEITGESTAVHALQPSIGRSGGGPLPPSNAFHRRCCGIPSSGRSPTTGCRVVAAQRPKTWQRRSRSKHSRLAPEQDAFSNGRYSYAHHKFSYVARGDYASQLKRWFRHVDRSRILVLESELLFENARRAREADGLARPVAARADPLPALNAAERSETDPDVVASLKQHFQPENEQLFAFLERRLWDR